MFESLQSLTVAKMRHLSYFHCKKVLVFFVTNTLNDTFCSYVFSILAISGASMKTTLD